MCCLIRGKHFPDVLFRKESSPQEVHIFGLVGRHVLQVLLQLGSLKLTERNLPYLQTKVVRLAGSLVGVVPSEHFLTQNSSSFTLSKGH